MSILRDDSLVQHVQNTDDIKLGAENHRGHSRVDPAGDGVHEEYEEREGYVSRISFAPWAEGQSSDDEHSPVGRARLSAATSSMVDHGACLKPAILPERFIPQTVKIVPDPFCIG